MARIISFGKPLEDSHESAADFAENPSFHCFSGSASKLFHDSLLIVGIKILFCA